MIDVATLSVIRRWALREHLSLREIARRTGLSRNTIKKYLRADTVEPRYAKRVSPSKLDPFADKLAGWLKTEAGKSRKQRRTVERMYADLAALGYNGSYNRVAAFARLWQVKRQEAERTTGRGTFVPLTFGAGEAFQFDWSEDWAVIGGERTKLQVAHTKLSHSRAFIVRAYLLQTHEMLFDAHNHAFRVLGGVPRRGIYDNMKTAVDKVRRGKERDVNARFGAMVSHFLFEAEFCNPASGWEKGQVEKNVRDARHRLWQHVPAFATLAALNDWLEARCTALWHEIDHGKLPAGVHATLAGVMLAFAIPFSARDDDRDSPSFRLEHSLHKPVAFIILPIFALANTAVILGPGWMQNLTSANSLGIAAGLVLGKPLGVTLFAFLAVTFGLSRLPADLRWRQVFGAGILGGIGFTMSIFITILAFPGDAETVGASKIAILFASLAAGTIGFLWLLFAGRPPVKEAL